LGLGVWLCNVDVPGDVCVAKTQTSHVVVMQSAEKRSDVMYIETVDWATSMPSLSNSPWILGAPAWVPSSREGIERKPRSIVISDKNFAMGFGYTPGASSGGIVPLSTQKVHAKRRRLSPACGRTEPNLSSS